MNIMDVVSAEQAKQHLKAEAERLRNTIAPQNPALTIADRQSMERNLTPITAFSDYTEEASNAEILIKGRWLERTGSAWIISTAGTGKSIHATQLAFCLSAGIEFSGLKPNIVNDHHLRFWIIQSEDSPSRITIDREDIICELVEQYPEIAWRKVAEQIMFVDTHGKIGADLIDYLNSMLTVAANFNVKPDILILNPFMAFVGGPITDGAYVTPFLRGGDINRIHTMGLQGLLTTHNIAALIYHHTPKPPTSDKDITSWLKALFPEYQGAGSADITNWGRSFITMQKIPKHSRTVCLTAGKNGGELGWSEIAGAKKHFLTWSGKPGIVKGSLRHAWRELTDEEYTEVSGEETAEFSDRINSCVNDAIKRMRENETAFYRDQFFDEFRIYTQRVTLAAWRLLVSPVYVKTYKYQVRNVVWGKTTRKYIGFSKALDTMVKQSVQKTRIDAGIVEPPERGEFVLPPDIENNDTLDLSSTQSGKEVNNEQSQSESGQEADQEGRGEEASLQVQGQVQEQEVNN